MQHAASLALSFALLGLAGCATRESVTFHSEFQSDHAEEDYVYYFPQTDFTKDNSEICEIHGTKMARRVVPIVYGTRLGEEFERQAKIALAHFPHAQTNCWLGCVDVGYKKARVFVCSECQQKEKDWIASQQ